MNLKQMDFMIKIISLFILMEGELLEMSKDFESRIREKNKEIAELKKFICGIYGLVRYADKNEDIYLLEHARSSLSESIMNFMNIDPDDLD